MLKQEFWELTPAQYNALAEQRNMIEAAREYGISQLCAMFYNVNAGKGARKLDARSFGTFLGQAKQKEETFEELHRKIFETASLLSGI